MIQHRYTGAYLVRHSMQPCSSSSGTHSFVALLPALLPVRSPTASPTGEDLCLKALRNPTQEPRLLIHLPPSSAACKRVSPAACHRAQMLPLCDLESVILEMTDLTSTLPSDPLDEHCSVHARSKNACSDAGGSQAYRAACRGKTRPGAGCLE